VDLAKNELPSDASPLLLRAKGTLITSVSCNAIELGEYRLAICGSSHQHNAGSGTGIFSITLGAVRSIDRYTTLARGDIYSRLIFVRDHIYGDAKNLMPIPLASAMPLLSHNISSNAQSFSSASLHPKAFSLDWDDEELPPEVQSDEQGFDVIL
jgi:hypothetical protein